MPEFDKSEVRGFLKEFKYFAATDGIYVVDSEELDRTLSILGLSRMNFKNEILGLSVLDYVSGPDPDINRPGYIWVFGKVLRTKEIYIKLKVAEIPSRDIAKCLSFHVAEKPFFYPFKTDK